MALGRPATRLAALPAEHLRSPKPPFNLTYFVACSLVGLVVVAFLVFPALFGFRRRAVPRQRVKEGRLPWWFWAGLVLGVGSWWLHWWGPVSWARFSFLTLWWALIIVVDGVVYHRAGGRSLLGTHPKRMVAIAAVSIPAWGFFEFLNYYAIEFWVYPSNQIFSVDGQAIWALLSSVLVWASPAPERRQGRCCAASAGRGQPDGRRGRARRGDR